MIKRWDTSERSYLLALLQELAASDIPDAPTLILGCEEPELYQHPPQARHLCDVFCDLSTGNNQILVTSHSPFFVSGNGFENTRMVQRGNLNTGTKVSSLTFERLCSLIRSSRGESTQQSTSGLIAKIHQALQPGLAEMFFTRVPVLVEGLEDVSYITTQLHLSNQWTEFRRLGCHIIPVNGKNKLIQPLAMAIEMGIPAFIIFDADGDTERIDHRRKHENDNRALISLLQKDYPAFPDESIITNNHAIWPTSLNHIVKDEFGDQYSSLADEVRLSYNNEGGLEKNDLFIAELLCTGYERGAYSPTLQRLCASIIEFAQGL